MRTMKITFNLPSMLCALIVTFSSPLALSQPLSPERGYLMEPSTLGVSQIIVDQSISFSVEQSVMWLVLTGANLEEEVVAAALQEPELILPIVSALVDHAPDQLIDVLVVLASVNNDLGVATILALDTYDLIMLPDLMDGLAEVITQRRYDVMVENALAQIAPLRRAWLEYAAYVGRHIPNAEDTELVGAGWEFIYGFRTEDARNGLEQPPVPVSPD